MLDKLSEKVLQYAINEYKPYLKTLTLDEETAAALGTDFIRLRSACEYLHKNEYIKIVRKSPCNECIITLTHKGFSYFEYKHIHLKEVFLNGILLPAITALITFLITTLVTNYI